jgi:ribosomal protein S18 acetylase RimI-like enzyme
MLLDLIKFGQKGTVIKLAKDGPTVIAIEHDDAGDGRVEPVIGPTEGQITQILALKEKCENRLGTEIILSADFLRALDKAGMGAFAFMKEGRVLGFVFFYSFAKEEAEGCIIADPDGDWKNVSFALLEAAKKECGLRGHVRLLVMNDRRSVSGAEFISEAGGRLSFSEHRMLSHDAPSISNQPIELRAVGNEDQKLGEIELECHGRFYSKPDQTRYLALKEGEAVGKIDVCEEGSEAELTGFCVVPRLRGRGLGKAILQGMVGILRSQGKEVITLDVQTDNDVALSLYLKSGFEKKFTMDYYEMGLEDIISDKHR